MIHDKAKNNNSIHPVQRGGKVWIEFKGQRREIFSNPYEFPFKKGDIAIVEADRGQDAGIVKHVASIAIDPETELPEFSVIRKATVRDREYIETLREREKDALKICQEKVERHNLPMKLIDAEMRFDGLKLIFYFTSEGRVDFRELVRDLAGAFRTRIELRQIGARDEVKKFEGYGVCGYPLCCVSFLSSFKPITTLMAKEQNLILNPSKLSGVCSKLKCCLAYEYEFYDHGTEGVPVGEIKELGPDEDLDNMAD